MKTLKFGLLTAVLAMISLGANAQNWGCSDEERESILEDVAVYQSSMKL